MIEKTSVDLDHPAGSQGTIPLAPPERAPGTPISASELEKRMEHAIALVREKLPELDPALIFAGLG